MKANNNQRKGLAPKLQELAAELEKIEGRDVQYIKRKKVKLPGMCVAKCTVDPH